MTYHMVLRDGPCETNNLNSQICIIVNNNATLLICGIYSHDKFNSNSKPIGYTFSFYKQEVAGERFSSL